MDLQHLFKLLLVVTVAVHGQDGESLEGGPGDSRLDRDQLRVAWVYVLEGREGGKEG